jgi:hypothetical protein
MDGTNTNDTTTIAPDIDPRKDTGPCDWFMLAPEVRMEPAFLVICNKRRPLQPARMFLSPLLKNITSTMPVVEVQHDQPVTAACANPDVRVWIPAPRLFNLVQLIGPGGLVRPSSIARVFPRRPAPTALVAAATILDWMMQRNHRIALLCKPHGGLKFVILAHLLDSRNPL